MPKKAENKITYTQEILRKWIHINWIIIPILYAFLEKEALLYIVISFTIFVLTIEILRQKNKFTKNLVNKIFGKMLREHEKKEKFLSLSGASYVLIASSILIYFFPKIIAISALCVLAISDAFASLIGRRFGRTKFFDKSLEGTLAFIFSGFITVSVIGFIAGETAGFFFAGAIGVLGAGLVEALSKHLKIDDNLTIPLTVGILMWFIV